jgi:hypothetical protein
VWAWPNWPETRVLHAPSPAGALISALVVVIGEPGLHTTRGPSASRLPSGLRASCDLIARRAFA